MRAARAVPGATSERRCGCLKQTEERSREKERSLVEKFRVLQPVTPDGTLSKRRFSATPDCLSRRKGGDRSGPVPAIRYFSSEASFFAASSVVTTNCQACSIRNSATGERSCGCFKQSEERSREKRRSLAE